MLIAPMSSAWVPSQTRWLLRRENSVIITRSHCARGGISICSSFSAARQYTRLLEMLAR